MTEIKVNALVVRENESGEYDKVLTVISEQYGKLYVVGKGVKSVRSRHMASCQLFSYASFSLRKKGNYYYITDSDLIENYYDIRGDMLKLALASFVCDVSYEIAKEGVEESELLRLTLNTLYAIAKDVRSLEIIRAAFELRVASDSGFMPDLASCRVCEDEKPSMACLDIMDGTIVCDECRKNAFSAIVKDSFYETGTPRPISMVSLSVLEAMRYIVSVPQKKFLSFSLDEKEHQVFFATCEKYLLNQLERGFYSLDFYKSLL